MPGSSPLQPSAWAVARRLSLVLARGAGRGMSEMLDRGIVECWDGTRVYTVDGGLGECVGGVKTWDWGRGSGGTCGYPTGQKRTGSPGSSVAWNTTSSSSVSPFRIRKQQETHSPKSGTSCKAPMTNPRLCIAEWGRLFEYRFKHPWIYLLSPFRSVVRARQLVHHIMHMPRDRSYSVRGSCIPDFVVRRGGSHLHSIECGSSNGKWAVESFGPFVCFPASHLFSLPRYPGSHAINVTHFLPRQPLEASRGAKNGRRLSTHLSRE